MRVGHARARSHHLEAARAQDLEQRVADVGLVLDHEDARPRSSCAWRVMRPRLRAGEREGSSGRRLPPPGRGSDASSPPCCAHDGVADRTGRGRSSPWSRRTARRCAARSAAATARPAIRDLHDARALLRLASVTAPRLPRGCASQALMTRFERHLPQHDRAAPTVSERRPRSARLEARHPRTRCRERMNSVGLREHAVEVHRGLGRLGGIGVGQHLAHHAAPRGRAPGVTPSSRRARPPTSPRSSAPRGQAQVVGHPLQRVVDLVGDARRPAGPRW